MLNRTTLIILILAALIIGGGIAVGNAVENLATEIAAQRVAALSN